MEITAAAAAFGIGRGRLETEVDLENELAATAGQGEGAAAERGAEAEKDIIGHGSAGQDLLLSIIGTTRTMIKEIVRDPLKGEGETTTMIGILAAVGNMITDTMTIGDDIATTRLLLEIGPPEI